MKIKFSYLVAFAATIVAACSAYYSVFGLSQLFAGASLSVILMASSLEFSKVVAVSILEKYWDVIGKALRVYLIIGVIVLVCITSAGIYGFLSNAYQKTASNVEITDAALSVIENKKSLFEKNITDNKEIIKIKSARVSQLSNLRTIQEGRIDIATTNSNKGKARADIDVASKEVQQLNSEIDNLNVKNTNLSDSVSTYANKSIEVKSKANSTSEIGPLKYLAQLTGYPMDKIINWFILLLIFVFDPLAVALVIATNKILFLEKYEIKPILSPPIIIEETPETESQVPLIVSDDFQIGPDGAYEHTDDQTVNEPIAEEVKIEQPIIEVPAIEQPTIAYKPDFVVPTGKIEVSEIKEKRQQTNRGFSTNIPNPTNVVERITTNKYGRR